MQHIFHVAFRAGDGFRGSGTRSRQFVPEHCLLAIAVLLCLGSLAFAEVPETVVPFRMVRGFAVLVPVWVNGHGPYDFMLDTGSTITAVDRELARELTLTPEGTGTVVTLAEHVPAMLAVAQRVSIGPIVERNTVVMIRDLDGLRRMAPSARGVLGQNALNHADFLLDYRHKVLEFDTDGELARSLHGHHLPLRRAAMDGNPQYANLAVHANVASDGAHPMDLVLDSGAASMVLFSSASDAATAATESFVADTAGQRLLAGIREVHLVLDGRARELPSHVLSLQGAEEGIGGLLPTRIFDRIYISNSGMFAIFEPKMKKARPDRMVAGLAQQPAAHGPKS